MAIAAAPRLIGLTGREAAERLREFGPNELPSEAPPRTFVLILRSAAEPMFLLLLMTGGLYVLLGDPVEATAVFAAVVLVVGLTIAQEQKTEEALRALRDLSSPRAVVVRDGTPERIAGRDVVPGDLIVLHEGDRVPADARLAWAVNVMADESLLTGESAPVYKTPAGEDASSVWSGTWIVRGEARAFVTATGAATEIGKIGRNLSEIEITRTALQREVDRVVRWLAVLGLGACGVFAVAYGISRHNWLDGALGGLTLAISMVPEEFPVILTVFLSLGAWRISRHHVLTRRLPAIETLGAATVLCVDKTGTLTMNRMSVTAVVTGDTIETGERPADLSAEARDVVAVAVRASRPDSVDPMERAFFDLAERIELPIVDGRMVGQYGLTDAVLAVAHVWEIAPDGAREVAVKGAPETIAGLCGLDAAQRDALRANVDTLAAGGLRILGVARGRWESDALPDAISGFRLDFLGLIGLSDPVRPGVPAAIAECHTAGIRVAMITGDHPKTAMSIARAIGLSRADRCLTGDAIAAMDDRALQAAAGQFDIFARVVPHQKFKLVQALKANGEVVAMTGDGVNDGPALKAADIGVAMGGRGTDVARGAAALVVLDDDFSSIVRAIRLGRRIYDNIQKATTYVLGIHVPIAGISLIPVLLGWPLILMPVHVLFMEFMTDPACAVAFEREPEEPDLMRRPPRRVDARLFAPALVVRSLLQGAGALAVSLATLVLTRRAGLYDADARTVTFGVLIVVNLAMMLANRSIGARNWRRRGSQNRAFALLTAVTLATLALIVYVPFLRGLFHVAPLHPPDLLAIGLAGIAAFGWMELTKRLTASSWISPAVTARAR